MARARYLATLFCVTPLLPLQAQPLVAHGDRVLIPIEARDRNYRTIRGLQKSDFRIAEGNHPVRDFTLSMEDAPASIVVLLDTSESMKPAWGEIPAALVSLFAKLQADDEMTLLTFAREVARPVASWTKDRDAMFTAVRDASPEGCTALYDGISEALRVARTGIHEKQVVIVLTDSGDSCSRKHAKDFLREVRETRAFLYVLSRYAFLQDPAYYHRLQLKEGSEWTGGDFLEYQSAKRLSSLMDRIDFRERYVASFAPPNAQRGKTPLRKVSVRLVAGPPGHVYLHWRHGYSMPEDPR